MIMHAHIIKQYANYVNGCYTLINSLFVNVHLNSYTIFKNLFFLQYPI